MESMQELVDQLKKDLETSKKCIKDGMYDDNDGRMYLHGWMDCLKQYIFREELMIKNNAMSLLSIDEQKALENNYEERIEKANGLGLCNE